MEGLGVYLYKNGSVYKGEFRNDDKNGYGELLYYNGDQYRGEWSSGFRHGYGIYSSKFGT